MALDFARTMPTESRHEDAWIHTMTALGTRRVGLVSAAAGPHCADGATRCPAPRTTSLPWRRALGRTGRGQNGAADTGCRVLLLARAPRHRRGRRRRLPGRARRGKVRVDVLVERRDRAPASPGPASGASGQLEVATTRATVPGAAKSRASLGRLSAVVRPICERAAPSAGRGKQSLLGASSAVPWGRRSRLGTT